MQCAPIVLFAYNRPDHLQQTVEALALNDLACSSELFIYSDAAKNESEINRVNEVRKYAKTVKGFLNVTVIEREKNFGLADSIVDGVSSLVKKYGKVIVLEDDIVTSPNFLHYMNTALDKYKDNHEVMHIAGYMPDIDHSDLPQAFFLRMSSCWGWATWDHAWRKFSRNGQEFISAFDEDKIKRFNLDGAYNYWEQLLRNERGELKTWAVFWYATVFMNNGLCLHPRSSLVRNIGFDGSGQNCNKSDIKVNFSPYKVMEFPVSTKDFRENELANARLKKIIVAEDPQKSNFVSNIFSKLKQLQKKFS